MQFQSRPRGQATRGQTPIPGEDLREHITHKLPKFFQVMVVKEEIGRQKNKFVVSVRYPPTLRRQTVLENVGKE